MDPIARAESPIYEASTQFENSSAKAERIRELDNETDRIMGHLGVKQAELKRLNYDIASKVTIKTRESNNYRRLQADITSMQADLDQKIAELNELRANASNA
jgi:chromosome segregation ATPase